MSNSNEYRVLQNRIRSLSQEMEEVRKRMNGIESGTEKMIVVNQEQCTGCGVCENICPREAITVDGTAQIDYDKCTICGRCAKECPTQAIEISSLKQKRSDDMPRNNSTGSNTGSGGGMGAGRGQGKGGGGRMGGFGMGSGGGCICPQCGTKVPHKRGAPCTSENCPKCGSVMTRET